MAIITIKLNYLKLNEFSEIFQLKVNTVLIKETKHRAFVSIDGSVFFKVDYELVKDFID